MSKQCFLPYKSFHATKCLFPFLSFRFLAFGFFYFGLFRTLLYSFCFTFIPRCRWNRLSPKRKMLMGHASVSPTLSTPPHTTQVQYPQAVDAMRDFQALARDAYSQWHAAWAARRSDPHSGPHSGPHPGRGPVDEGSWERFAWALQMVQSRSIRLAVTGCRAMIPGVGPHT